MSLLLAGRAAEPKPTRISAAEFLRQSPRGAYTSLVVRQGRAVLHWKQHVARLHESLDLLGRQGVEAPSTASAREVVAAAVLPCVEVVCRTLSRTGLRSAMPDVSIVVLLDTSPSGNLCASLHATPIRWPAATLMQPCEVGLFQVGPRRLARAKVSTWVDERYSSDLTVATRTRYNRAPRRVKKPDICRAPLEARLTRGTEGVLCTPGGQLLEGFVSNLFVVQGGVVLTADPSSDAVLDGVMRREVLQQCDRLQIPVRQKAPCLQESASWQEAFITNCRRMLQPVAAMAMAGAESARGEWSCQMQAPGSVTELLYNACLRSDMDALELAL